MKTDEKSVPVLLVSMYEIVRTGVFAVLLKMEPGIISEIKETNNVGEASVVYDYANVFTRYFLINITRSLSLTRVFLTANR